MVPVDRRATYIAHLVHRPYLGMGEGRTPVENARRRGSVCLCRRLPNAVSSKSTSQRVPKCLPLRFRVKFGGSVSGSS